MKRRVRQVFPGRIIAAYSLQLISLWAVAFGLANSIPKISLATMLSMAILGLSFGWIFSRTRLKDWHTSLLTVFIGVTGTIYYSTRLTRPITALINSTINLVGDVISRTSDKSTSISSINLAAQQINTRLTTFFSQLLRWVESLKTGQVGNDDMVVGLVWGLGFWLVAVWAGWLLFRHHSSIVSILPATVILAGALSYEAGNSFYIIPLIGTTLAIKAITNYDQQESHWVENHVDYAEDIRFDLELIVPALAIGFMLISFVAPVFSMHRIVTVAQSITQKYQGRIDDVAISLGLQPRSGGVSAFAAVRSPGLPRSHLLGSGPELSKEVVMVIEADDHPPAQSAEILPVEPYLYYWRSMTYDIYTGHGWQTSPFEVSSYKSNQASIEDVEPITGTLHLVHQSVQFSRDAAGQVFAAGQLISLDHSYQVAWRLPPQVINLDNVDSIVDEFGALSKASGYTADSYINIASASQLRKSAGEIPAWIKERYLALPDHLPERIRMLAVTLTEEQSSDYDRAVAIETYLRTFPYTLDLPIPPADRDVVDYFLFDLQRGYCDYYASAMVVLSRSIGLPARLVTGFSSGSYDPINSYYVITEADAHSWVEVYLPGAGWVEFEPTASLPEIPRPAEQTGKLEIPKIRQARQFNLLLWLNTLTPHWLEIIGGLLTALLLSILLTIYVDQWRLQHFSPPFAIMTLYRRLYLAGEAITEGHHPEDTPLEFARRVSQRILILAQKYHLISYFMRSIDETNQLTRLFMQAVYSPHTPAAGEQKEAVQAWNHLRGRLWLAASLDRIKKLSFRKKN